MAKFNARESKVSGSGTFETLPTDVYYMAIKKAVIEEDKFAEPDENGVYPDKLVITWEVSRATDEQDDDVVGKSVWYRLVPWYGTGKRGDSKFKLFIDGLAAQGLLTSVDMDEFDTDWLIDIEQRVSVEEYTKTMGPNKGELGNKVVSVLPMKAAKKTAPVPQATVKPVKRNVPVPVEEEEETEIPF